ncbi:NAD(P)-dependent dehydrogenase (short-subunit alcohol dehydrogenase family) [Pigmentiphaga litoralis]|uniref:NAD(P)-dependent dehydrogenase (Short-subunit alcohol dehydrogenase family) n=1 Tax=Pigmentiphaga litoralis TaxID=516702 RepID=A0A7Y9IQV3_9BURK|nr:NAD(P)-dependent dehydrogenase (short-subunit alcohol dehydrogenase family) [Pigmentiphaga litoralis]NYE81401.1 NAD(P)-dependent dehydrogenase (short-subunit alcohol dehydrogenase family) [Pigmentiphaga litoralis]
MPAISHATCGITHSGYTPPKRAPVRRAAIPAEIAQAVSMLIESHYVTGEILLSDGGLNLT